MPDGTLYVDLFMEFSDMMRSPVPAIREKAKHHYEYMERMGRVSGLLLVERLPDTAARLALRCEKLSDWERDFLSSLARWPGSPTEKQMTVLRRLCTRASAEAVRAHMARSGQRAAT